MVIYKHKIFKDEYISTKTLIFLFAIKCLACFFYVYEFGIDIGKNLFNSDTQAYMRDASTIYQALWNNPIDYLKLISGIYSETETSYFYQNYFKSMEIWNALADNQFHLNDSKGIIRINAFFMLFSFGKYEVQALFMAFLSFIGGWLTYKTLKTYFNGKELLLLIVLFFIPSVYFWTAGVLKEAIVVFSIGCFLYSYFKLFIHQTKNSKHFALMLLSVVIFLIVKLYVFIIIIIPLLIFTFLNKKNYRKTGLIYFISIAIIGAFGILFSKHILKKDIVSTIVKRQNDFVSASYGGVFFYNYERYIRFEYNDTAMFKLKDVKQHIYTIKPHARFMYWQYPNFNDTLYIKDNSDTISEYPLISSVPPAKSALTTVRLKNSYWSVFKMLPTALSNTLCKPFFINIKNKNELLVSVENLLLLLFFIFCFIYGNYKNINWNLFFFLLSVTVMAFLLIGLTSTLSGAIVRYKVPFLPFLVMIPLLIYRGKHSETK